MEGAIGSPRKLDATYLSNEVELAEFLESSTKKYGTSVLISGTFFRLLHPSNQRCRQNDEAFFEQEYGDFADEELVDIPEEESESFMRLYTFDIDVKTIHTLNEEAMNRSAHEHSTRSDIQGSIDDTNASVRKSIFRSSTSSLRRFTFQRFSYRAHRQSHGDLLRCRTRSHFRWKGRRLLFPAKRLITIPLYGWTKISRLSDRIPPPKFF